MGKSTQLTASAGVMRLRGGGKKADTTAPKANPIVSITPKPCTSGKKAALAAPKANPVASSVVEKMFFLYIEPALCPRPFDH